MRKLTYRKVPDDDLIYPNVMQGYTSARVLRRFREKFVKWLLLQVPVHKRQETLAALQRLAGGH